MVGASASPAISANLVIEDVHINGTRVRGLIDSGASRTIVGPHIPLDRGRSRCRPVGRGCVLGFDGTQVRIKEEADATVGLAGRTVTVPVLRAYSLLGGVDVIVGMDVLGAFCVTIDKGKFAVVTEDCDTKVVELGKGKLQVQGRNFSAWFADGFWTVKWDWRQEPALSQTIGQYAVAPGLKEDFERGVEKWIENGWLHERPEPTLSTDAGRTPTVPLMAVHQPTKRKVRPVMDYREMNEYVEASGAEADVCADKLREWRQFPANSSTMDIRDAYMQVRVHPDCSRYQSVRYKNKHYELTRMGFGLNCAPQILKAIVSAVLSLVPEIQRATSAYFDDVIVDEDKVSSSRVAAHLEQYGLPCKPPVPLGQAAVLGLRLYHHDGTLKWKRPEPVEGSVSPSMTRRQLFSLCGKWVGHFPVAGWLRPAASYVKRFCDDHHRSWETPIGVMAAQRATEIQKKLQEHDPVKGTWRVQPHSQFTVWCDASSIAMGVALEVDGVIVEDMSWLRKKDTAFHINVAELSAVIKGISLSLKWGAEKLVIVTDSATVHYWLSNLKSKDNRIRVKGESEMLVKRRLQIIDETLCNYNVDWSVRKVDSDRNKADVLTRVPKKWVRNLPTVCASTASLSPAQIIANRAHDVGHRGVQSTLLLAKDLLPSVTEREARMAVNSCEMCSSINPTPVQIPLGTLHVPTSWKRLAADVTHVADKKYLTMIDCGPSRFAVWKPILREEATLIVNQLEDVFRTLGAPKEIIFDNGKSFRSGPVRQICDKWKVKIHFRCADRPSGNAIVERSHKTIKDIAIKRNSNVLDAVAIYNLTVNPNTNKSPSCELFNRQSDNPFVWDPPKVSSRTKPLKRTGPFKVGDLVWVKPPHAKCVDPWKEGTVTKIVSERNVEVNGMPRHPKDLRKRSPGWHHAANYVRCGGGGGANAVPLSPAPSIQSIPDLAASPSQPSASPPASSTDLQNTTSVSTHEPSPAPPTIDLDIVPPPPVATPSPVPEIRRSTRLRNPPSRFGTLATDDEVDKVLSDTLRIRRECDVRGRGRGRGNFSRGVADTGRGDHSLEESQREPSSSGAWGDNRPIVQRSDAASTGWDVGGYKSPGGGEDRGDSSSEVRSEDAGEDLGGDSGDDQQTEVSEDRSERQDPGGDLESNTDLQPD